MTRLRALRQPVFASTRGETAKSVASFGLLQLACVVLALCAAMTSSSVAQTFTTLYGFCVLSNCADGAGPQGALLQASDGNFYGTTSSGGTHGYGTIFKITASGSLTALYNFDGTDGASPRGSLIQATDGNFYGTSSCGGGLNYIGPGPCNGTIFKITTGGTLTTLYRFCSQTNCPDGIYPQAGLIQAADGDFYGTTYGGGATGHGTIFQITAGGTLTTIYSFCSKPNCADGSWPYASLLQATDGNFYGTTSGGGSGTCGNTNSCGTLFQLTPSGVLSTFYNFCSQASCSDGGFPSAGVIQATDGNFYGTTGFTIFRITAAGSLTTLHTFVTSGTLVGPNQLVQASDGNLYGTTYGGTNYYGVIYEITLAGTFTTIHNFNGNYGGWAEAGLIQASDGRLYGTTWSGGGALCGRAGTFFSLVLSPSAVAISPTSLGFCGQAINEVSLARTVTFTNKSTVPLTIGDITIGGNFAISANTCGAMLLAGKACKVAVTGTPTALSLQTGALTFTDSAANSPQTVPLSIKGIADAALTPASVTFAKQTQGTTSTPKTFTLNNHELLALNSISISTTGDFAVSATTCGASLAAKGKCTISVTFTPTAKGITSGQLNISDSASDSPQTANLGGTGN
jgi:uncharacterized repeat protein (TIGR03803 family)